MKAARESELLSSIMEALQDLVTHKHEAVRTAAGEANETLRLYSAAHAAKVDKKKEETKSSRNPYRY